MKRFQSFPLSRDLGLQLLALYLLFVTLVVVTALVFENLAAARLEADVRAADLALARAIAQETNVAMDNALRAVRELATYPAVVGDDPAGMAPLFSTFMSGRSDINLIYRLDAQGIMRYHYPEGPESTVGVDFSFRDYFQRALSTTEPLVSLGRISPTTGQPVATAVMPLRGARFDGLVGTNLRLQSISVALATITDEYPAAERPQIFIVDSGGNIIAHPDPAFLLEDVGETLPGVVGAVLAQRAGNQVLESGGEATLFSYVPISSVGWGVVVSRPTAVAFATLTAVRQGMFLVIAIFLVSGVFFWFALSRRVFRPVEELAAFSQTVALDEPRARSAAALEQLARRHDQIGYLARSLARMQEAIAARLHELSTLLQTSSAVVSSLDSPTVLDRILEQVEQLLDTRMCAIFAQDEVTRRFACRPAAVWTSGTPSGRR